jgi:hypothetical protein
MLDVHSGSVRARKRKNENVFPNIRVDVEMENIRRLCKGSYISGKKKCLLEETVFFGPKIEVGMEEIKCVIKWFQNRVVRQVGN